MVWLQVMHSSTMRRTTMYNDKKKTHIHARDLRRVPAADVIIEDGGAIKHAM